jgi:small-conductance mechanosensitive channel
MEGNFSILRFFHPDQLPVAIGVAVLGWLLLRLATRFLEGLGERITAWRLGLKQLAVFIRFLVLTVLTILVVSMLFEVTDEVMLAVGGSVAVAVGLALKDVLGSLVAGVILLFDRPFRVGDRVTFGTTYGEVVEIGLRTVRIVTLDDNLVSIPSSRFLSDAVASANAGALDQMCVFDFHVGCDADIDLARRIVYEATASSRFVFLGKPIAILVRELPVEGAMTFALRITAKAYVLDGRLESAFGTDVTERVKRAFRSAGVPAPRGAGQA